MPTSGGFLDDKEVRNGKQAGELRSCPEWPHKE